MNAMECFEKNRYVFLTNAVSHQQCASLTQHMFQLYEENKLEKDDQCPLSDSIYGDPIFDELAASLAPVLSKQLGIELLPTYTYCRIYRPGEVLVRHRDRPSCEISGTMTLGFDENSCVWPIYFAKEEDDLTGIPIDINVGDLVMYRGCELPHWRPKFKGIWQVQVFFHYVDAKGPYKNNVFDGRPKMGASSNTREDANIKKISANIIHNGIMIRNSDNSFPGFTSFRKDFRPELCFTDDECRQIISLSEKKYPEKSKVGSGEDTAYNSNIREVLTYHIELGEDTQWIFDKIARAVGIANAEFYNFNLLGITHSLQLLHYEGTENGHYQWHIDAGPGESSTRKISVVVPLNSPSEFEGGLLEVNDNGTLLNAPQDPGSVIMFPSFTLHKVHPVTQGNRWSLVSWVHGPDRFK